MFTSHRVECNPSKAYKFEVSDGNEEMMLILVIYELNKAEQGKGGKDRCLEVIYIILFTSTLKTMLSPFK
jgi:hypothetical protein